MASTRRLRYRLLIAFITFVAVGLGMIVIQAQQDSQPLLGVRTVITEHGTQVVEVVSGTPAEAAGFHVGDVIVAINEELISPSNPLDAVLIKYRPGVQIQCTVLRDGTRLTLAATLGFRSALQTTASSATQVGADTGTPLAITPVVVTPLPATVGPISPVQVTAGLATPPPAGGFLGVRLTDAPNGGARVTTVLPGSPADAAGIRAGDVILVIDDRAISTAEQVQTVIGGKMPGDTVVLRIRRDDTLIAVPVRLSPRPPEGVTPPVVVTAVPLPPSAPTISMSFPNLGFLAMFDQTGLRVIEVSPNGPARSGGLMVGDVVMGVDEIRYNMRDVAPVITRLLSSPRPRLVVARNGAQINIQLVVTTTLVPTPGPNPAGGRLGVSYDVVTAAIAQDRGLAVDYGALVLTVAPNSPADIAGIKAGDIITAVDGDKVDAKHTLAVRMAAYSAGDTLTLTVVRGGQTLQLPVTLASRGVAQADSLVL